MRDVFKEDGTRLQLGRELGSGGQGAVYEVSQTQVAKIYHEPPDLAVVDKLRSMVRRARPELLSIAAWPSSLQYSTPNGRAIGFMMPIVRGRHEIFKLYTPATRKHTFPHADFRFLLFAARNVAIAVSEVHAVQSAIGDLNERNVLVGDDAKVVLIDCDSFQVVENGRVFRCPVGVAHYTAPELQGKSFSEMNRSESTDSFALAVLLFQILCLARYPFITALTNGTESSLEESVRSFRFAWAPDAQARGVQVPPRAIPLSALGDLGPLFVDAFSPNRPRPRPADWISAITGVEQSLSKCPRSEGHAYPRSAGRCPWCELITQGVSDPFFTITIRTASLSSWPSGTDPDALIRGIEGLPRPESIEVILARTTTAVLPRPFVMPPPLGKAPATMHGAVWVVIVVVGLVAVVSNKQLQGSLCAGTAIAGIAAAVIASSMNERAAKHRLAEEARNQSILQQDQQRRSVAEIANKTLEHALIEVRRHDTEWSERRKKVVGQLREIKINIDRLPSTLPDKLRQMESKLIDLQRADFLEQFDVEDAKIDRFPRSIKKTLKNYNVCSASDVTLLNILNIPGVGEVRRSQLLAWRRECERSFVPDPRKGLTEQDRQRAIFELSQEREKLGTNMQSLSVQFQQQHTSDMASSSSLRNIAVQAKLAADQATADLRVLPTSLRWSI